MENEYSTAQRSKFRFKSKHRASRSRSKSETPHDDGSDGTKSQSSSHPRRYRRRHHRHRPSKRHKSSNTPPPTYEEPPELSPDAAFRESLFDALADDEGAAYWESVYGQPIHTYARPDLGGELEQMTDEEYAAYVRARMWEKTHEAVFEERERRKKERERQRDDNRRTQGGSERESFERMIEESLRRGQERKMKKRTADVWLDIWRRYLDTWEDLNARARAAASKAATASSSSTSKDTGPSVDKMNEKLRNLIFWPVESGKRRDITPGAVETFMRNAPIPTPADTPASGLEQRGKLQSHPSDLLTVLKIERVRWHPDKMQHRYGALGMEDQLIKGATEVFQILDRMWVKERELRDKG
ncbi:hypothetical protein RJZ56_004858 [Blastomyces dermatitidis]|uniref:NF-kappa-B inhibitor-like protein 1 n=1 Tax=Ajellomyces dermatitidis (strain ER-3 / ATCC MYA-2586) TaxID=559297 RepID=A0ABP2EUF9_AJEDR|nr:uncharacterized protein BDCG_02588 [Blastomyces dermatitidis ER-3]EEQ87468.1 hypothetical protein BDCG_02588 [Blastomyces dermatitidis ER-3]EQL38242.1 hypothetical protein BDFG_00610 [Blastomyces dermatitidis ATCC 26199]